MILNPARSRHSLLLSRLCRFLLLFGDIVRDIDCSDEVPPDDDGLLFRPCAGNHFRLLHLDFFHEGADDLGVQFRDIRVLAYHAEKRFRIANLAPEIARFSQNYPELG